MAKFPLGPLTNNVVGNPIPNHIRNTGPGKPVAPTVPGTGGFMNPGQPRGNGGGGGQNDTMPAFMPGQLGALSQQMNFGFGGGADKWRDYLRQTNDPTPVQNFNYATFGDPAKKPNNGDNGHNGHNGDGGGDPNNNGHDTRNPNDFNDHSRMAMAGAPMMMPQAMQGSPMGGILSGQMQAPQGILSGAMPMQQQAEMPNLPPQIPAMLRARMMGG